MMTALLLFCGCAKNNPTDKINRKYSELENFSCGIRYTIDSGDYLTAFEMALDYSPEGCELRVDAPSELKGLSVRVEADTAEVVYGERVLVLDSLKGLNVSPVRVIPDILDTLKKGMISSYSNQGIYEYYSSIGGRELCYLVRFGEDLLPLKTEVLVGGETVAAVEFIYGEE